MPALSPLPAGGWASLQSLPMDEWLWLDMVAPGIHLESTLPATQPAQISHVWGWSSDTLVRARVDLDLPSGVAGAILRLGPNAPGEMVHVRTSAGRRWAPGDGRVRVAYPPNLQERARGLTLYEVTRTTVSARGRSSMMPLDFVRLDQELATYPAVGP